MTYKFNTDEEKKEHYKITHLKACRAYNAKNKENAKELYISFEAPKRVVKRCNNMALKLELLRFSTIDGIFE